MAQQKSIIKLHGTLNGITFYNSVFGYIARSKGGPSSSQVANDPSFARTRENAKEFGHSSRMGTLLRKTVLTLSKNASDNRLTPRMAQIMTKIKDTDTLSARGERNVATGLATAQGKELLKGFDFNIKAPLSTVLRKRYELIPNTGALTIDDLSPKNDIVVPQGATHIVFKAAVAAIGFATGESELAVSCPVRIAVGSRKESIELTPSHLPANLGTTLSILCIEFVQEVNGDDYSLQNGAFNAMSIVGVA